MSDPKIEKCPGTYSDEETARRRDELAKRMLNMPPRPLKPKSAKRGQAPNLLRASSFLFDRESIEPLKNILKGLIDRGFNDSLINCHLDISKPVKGCPARLAGDDVIIGWAVQIDGDGAPTLVAFDAGFNVVIAHT
jgi:hypothetical protein